MANSGTDREGTFGRTLQNFITSKLPYGKPHDVIDNVGAINPKFKDFFELGSRREELLRKHSISINDPSNVAQGGVAIDKNYHAFMYANVDHDKSKRLRDYRVMGQFAEVADALDEICDECVVRDDNGKFIHLNQTDKELDTAVLTKMQDEFDKFVNYYQIDKYGWEYFRHLLVDGEVYFEHIIHSKHKDKGILGIVNIPAELMDPIYDNVQNMQIKGFLLRKPVEKGANKYGKPGQSSGPKDIHHIPFDSNQITYIHSGIWNETKTLRLPFIENARRAYRQLSLIEDAIIVYRLVRAPERLVFNVDVGNMAPPKAEAYLKKLMQNYWSRKTYDSGQGKSVQAFNPQSMLDSFWFAKRAGSDGTDVRQLQGGANLGELSDLLYFKEKLYRSLKVPISRLNADSQADAQGNTILREELKFAKFVMRLQQALATGLKNAFISHLRLRGIWDKHNVKETDFDIKLTEPSNFHELRQQQIHELKFNNYQSMANMELISDTYAKKKYLGWSDKQVLSNREFLRKDAALAWELQQIAGAGPGWKEQQTAEADAIAGAPPTGAPGGGAPPAFGPGPTGGTPPPPGDVGEGDTDVPAPAPTDVSGPEDSALPT
jgi:hypothetical protein